MGSLPNFQAYATFLPPTTRSQATLPPLCSFSTPGSLQLLQDFCICRSICPECSSSDSSIYRFLPSTLPAKLQGSSSGITSVTTLFKGRSCPCPFTLCHVTLLISFIAWTTPEIITFTFCLLFFAVFLYWNVCSIMTETLDSILSFISSTHKST